MKKLRNTLYITTPDIYIAREGECLLACTNDKKSTRIPANNIDSLIYFGYSGVSMPAIELCMEKGITVSLLKPNGQFIARIEGGKRGSINTRKKQYKLAENKNDSTRLASRFTIAKITNCRSLLRRGMRDYEEKAEILEKPCNDLRKITEKLWDVKSYQEVLGWEGKAATIYFNSLPELILDDSKSFKMTCRNKRPPKDRTNCLLSFGYALLAHDCRSACEAVGLDSQMGFLHKDRPGRESLALDLMEELRAVYADRFMLTLINRRQVKANDFIIRPQKEVLMSDKAKKIFIDSWQKRKQSLITHPFINEKIQFGLIPYVQALLLSQHIRGMLDDYPAFIWR